MDRLARILATLLPSPALVLVLMLALPPHARGAAQTLTHQAPIPGAVAASVTGVLVTQDAGGSSTPTTTTDTTAPPRICGRRRPGRCGGGRWR